MKAQDGKFISDEKKKLAPQNENNIEKFFFRKPYFLK